MSIMVMIPHLKKPLACPVTAKHQLVDAKSLDTALSVLRYWFCIRSANSVLLGQNSGRAGTVSFNYLLIFSWWVAHLLINNVGHCPFPSQHF
jgi:hypothetical protein